MALESVEHVVDDPLPIENGEYFRLRGRTDFVTRQADLKMREAGIDTVYAEVRESAKLCLIHPQGYRALVCQLGVQDRPDAADFYQVNHDRHLPTYMKKGWQDRVHVSSWQEQPADQPLLPEADTPIMVPAPDFRQSA